MKRISEFFVAVSLLLLGIAHAAAPANDNLANAEVLQVPASGLSLVRSNVDATAELGELFHPDYNSWTPTNTVWFRIPAPAGGKNFTVTAERNGGSRIYPILSVYRGGQAQGVGALEPIATKRTNGPDDGALVDFQVPQNNALDYFVSIDGSYGYTGNLLIKFHAPPANDNFAGAEQLGSGYYYLPTSGNNIAATVEPGEVSHPSHSSSPQRSVWYRLPSQVAGRTFVVSAYSFDFNTRLSLFRGNIAGGVGGLVPVAAGYEGTLLETTVPNTTGGDYFVAIDGDGSGDFTLRLWTNPTNDHFTAATPLDAGTSAHLLEWHNTIGASAEPGETSHPSHSSVPYRTVWFRVPSPATGRSFQVTIPSTYFTPRVSIFRGHAENGLEGLVPVAATTGTTPVTVTAPNSTEGDYFISVDSGEDFHDADGFYIELHQTPSNDSFASAKSLEPDDSYPTSGVFNTLATKQTGEPGHVSMGTPERSVWYRIQAPPQGASFTVSTAGSNFDTFMTLYRGHILNSITSLQVIDGNNDSDGGTTSKITFTVPDNSRLDYFIAVDGFAGASGEVKVSMTATPPNGSPAPSTVFPATSAEPHELFAGGIDSFDLDGQSITFMPHQVTVNGHPETHYRYSTRQIQEFPENLSTEEADDSNGGTLPAGFKIFGESAVTATAWDGDIISFENAAGEELLPEVRILDADSNWNWRDEFDGLYRSFRSRESAEKLVLQFDFHAGRGIDSTGDVFHVSYQVELFATGMIRISFLGVDATEGDIGLFKGAVFPPETDFSEVRLRLPELVVAEANGAIATFQPTLSPSSTQALPLRAITSDGTALRNLDYQSRDSLEQIPAGSTSTVIAVPLVGDSMSEAEEYFTLRLVSPGDPNWIFAEARAWITDSAPSASLAPRFEVAGNRIHLIPPPGTSGVITGFRIVSVTGGTVRLPSSTTPLPSGATITIAQGAEGLIASGPGATLRVEAINAGGASHGAGSLDLDGESGSPVFQFARETYEVNEGSNLSFTVLASAAGSGVSYDVIAGSASVSGSASDIVTTPRSLEFRQGRATLSIPVLADGVTEGPESFEVRLVNPTAGAHLGPISTARITILDGSGPVLSSDVQRFPLEQASGRTFRVVFDSEDFAGQAFTDSWRLAGEMQWRNGNENFFNVGEGMHRIEFRPATGVAASGYKNPATRGIQRWFAAPDSYVDQSVFSGLYGFVVDYAQDAPIPIEWDSDESPGTPVTGSLTVVPGTMPTGAQWRRIGETTWRNPSTTETSVPVGEHWIEFKDGVSDYFAPGPKQVQVSSDAHATVTAIYRLRPATAILPELVTEPDMYVSGSNWLNVPVMDQSGHFRISFEMQPTGTSISTMVGLAPSAVSNETGLSTIVRASNGIIDGWNSGSFGFDESFTYQPGLWYFVEMEVDVPGNTYHLTVTPPSGSPVRVLDTAAFRTSATELRYLAMQSSAGSHKLRNIRVEALEMEETYVSNTSSSWTNIPIGSQMGNKTITFDFKPSGSSIDTLVGLSDATADDFGEVAAILRAKNGVFDGWNGSAYGALATLNYQTGKWHHVRFDINVTNKTYGLTVTPPGGTPVLLLNDAGFRDQATSLTNLSMRSVAGSHVVRRVLINGRPLEEDDWTAIPIPVQTKAFEAQFLLNVGYDDANDDGPPRFGLSLGAAPAPTQLLAELDYPSVPFYDQTGSTIVTLQVNPVTRTYSLGYLDSPDDRATGTLPSGFNQVDHIYIRKQGLLGIKDMLLPPHEVAPSGPAPANDLDDWLYVPIPPQTGRFSLTYEVVTKEERVGSSGDFIDGIVGLSDSKGSTQWSNVSVALRAKLAGGSGVWQAHTAAAGDGFSHENAVPVVNGKRYLVELVVDVPADRFRATVRPEGGVPMVIASDAPFRKNVSELRYLVLRNVQGRLAVSNLRTPLPAPEAAPAAFTGQIETELGFSSGTVVADYAVLTSARHVFDPARLAFTRDVVWRLPGHRLCAAPEMQQPNGIILVSGYASALLADASAGTAADQVDVAVLAFRPTTLPDDDNSPASGGFSGFLVDSGSAAWTAAGTQRLLAGFPMSNLAAPENRGKIHQANVTTATFTTVAASLHAMTTNLPDCAPGFEGASLFARQTNGSYLPAAICLGTASGQLRFRAIDAAVADAIHQANSFQRQPVFHQSLNKGGAFYIPSTVAGTPNPNRSRIFSDAIPATATWTLYATNYGDGDSLTSTGGQAVSLEPDDYYVAFGNPPSGYMINPAQTFDYSTEDSQHCLRKNLKMLEEWHLPPVYIPEPPKTWQEWQLQSFSVTELSRNSVIAPESTETFLGVENVIAYAFGFDPKISKTWHADPATMTPGYPILRRPSPTAPLQLEFLRRRDSGLLYRVEATDNLSGSWPWTLEAGYPNSSSFIITGASNDTWEYVRIPLTGLGPDAARKFVRVMVELKN